MIWYLQSQFLFKKVRIAIVLNELNASYLGLPRLGRSLEDICFFEKGSNTSHHDHVARVPSSRPQSGWEAVQRQTLKLLESWEETEENDQVIANQACLIRSWIPEP